MEEMEERALKGAWKIEEVFQNGFSLDSKVLHYIDSTFSNPSAEEIEKLLTGESDFEKEALLKLIFFPDESIRVLLEELFEKGDVREEERIRVYFSGKMIRTKIKFPDERGTLEIMLPPRIADEFVLRLNISKSLGEKLTNAVSAVSCEKRRVFARVKLKESGIVFSGKTADFFTLFFERLGAEKEDFNESLELVLNVLCEAGNDDDIYRALLCKKAASHKSLICAERFEEQLEKSNIETLLLQGVRPFSTDRDAEIRRMRIIDRICLAVFGKTEYYENHIASYQILNTGE